MILSLIIPVYNVEKYVRFTLESIYSQSISENLFEVIIVNDGTSDNSMVVVDNFSYHSNIRIINQNNKGLSCARNAGLEIANGDYVWFIDSDDSLLQGSIKQVINTINVYNGIDVIASVLMMYYESTENEKLEYKAMLHVKTGKEYIYSGNRIGASQRYILKRKFLLQNNIKFMDGVFHEDGEFGLKMLYQAKSLYIIPTPLYRYLIRISGSITSSRKIKMNYDLVRIYDKLVEFCNQRVDKDDYWKFMAYSSDCLFSSIIFSNNIIYTKEFKIFYNKYKEKFRIVAYSLLKHPFQLSCSQYIRALHFYLFPIFWTKFKMTIRMILKM